MACQLVDMPLWSDKKINEEKVKNAELWKNEGIKDTYDDTEVDKERGDRAKLMEERRKKRELKKKATARQRNLQHGRWFNN